MNDKNKKSGKQKNSNVSIGVINGSQIVDYDSNGKVKQPTWIDAYGYPMYN